VEITAVITVDAAASQTAPGRPIPGLTALEQVANKPILYHALDALRAAGVENLIIAGDADPLIDLRSSLHEYWPETSGIQYAVRREGVSLTSTLKAISPLLGDAACLMQPADGLLTAPVPQLAGVLDAECADLVLFAVGDGQEDELARHRDGARANALAIAHAVPELGLFAPGVIERLAILPEAEAAELSAAGQRLSEQGATVRIHRIDGWHRYRGQGGDLLELNRIVLDRLKPIEPRSLSRSNRLEGRLSIDPSALVCDSVIIGPTVIGPDAIIRDAYIGPYTSVGAGARIEGVEIERSIVAAGASVTHVGVRLVSSLVGRNARVFRDFSLPRAVRLWVGDGDEVALC
jgi:glucose-1-phosphate thymidylyltransferase